MATPVDQLTLPTVLVDALDRSEREAVVASARSESWLAKSLFGYMVYDYDDVVAILRDKRWHSAASVIVEMSGITDPAFTENRRESILSAEGDVHTRLRRLVAPAFSPRAADRLRPYMRAVMNGLVDQIATSGRTEFVVDVCDPYPIPIICELLGAPKEDWRLFSRWAGVTPRTFFNV